MTWKPSCPLGSLDEELVLPTQQPARPLLRDEVRGSVGRRLAHVHGERLVQQLLELLLVLLAHGDTLREAHVRERAPAAREGERALEVAPRLLARAPHGRPRR